MSVKSFIKKMKELKNPKKNWGKRKTGRDAAIARKVDKASKG